VAVATERYGTPERTPGYAKTGALRSKTPLAFTVPKGVYRRKKAS